MTIRTLDAASLNQIAEHPEVRPFLGFPDPKAAIDLAPQVRNPDNFAFVTPHRDGAYLLLKVQPGLYAAHTLAMPSARGKPMLKLMRDGFATMFRATDAIEIVSQVPDGNDNAEGWSRLAGFRDTFRREGFFPLMGEMVGCQFKSLTYGDWVPRDNDNLARGRMFHDQIFAAHGHETHPEDRVHDCWVGATIGGCIEGNAVKAVNLYNRWAGVAGYAQASLISTNPIVVHTGDAVVQLEGGRMDVLLSQARSASGTLEGSRSCQQG